LGLVGMEDLRARGLSDPDERDRAALDRGADRIGEHCRHASHRRCLLLVGYFHHGAWLLSGTTLNPPPAAPAEAERTGENVLANDGAVNNCERPSAPGRTTNCCGSSVCQGRAAILRAWTGRHP